MKLELTRSEMLALALSINSVVKAGTLKEPEMKANSTDKKVLDINRTILEKVEYAAELIEKEKRIVETVEVNRQEAKVLIATMLLTSQLQANALKEYESRPDDHASFSKEEGRAKADYVSRLKNRISEVSSVLNKIRKAL